jgi:hypothetical protein
MILIVSVIFFVAQAQGATTLSITTFSITMLCHYAECRILFIVMLNIVMLSVVILSVVAHKPTQCFINPIHKVMLEWSREVLRGGEALTVDLLVLTSLDQLIFILKILFSFLTKQATLMRRSTVPSLPPQLEFPGKGLQLFQPSLQILD